LASRLEGINKFYWTNICASENVIEKLKEKDLFIYRFLDIIKVKWKNKPVKIYEILPIFSNEMWTSQLKILKNKIKQFEKWLNLYIKWNFKEALKIFEELKNLYDDKVATVFYERCLYLIQNPPKNRDWIWKFKQK
jgi:adenylate cyclase